MSAFQDPALILGIVDGVAIVGSYVYTASATYALNEDIKKVDEKINVLEVWLKSNLDTKKINKISEIIKNQDVLSKNQEILLGELKNIGEKVQKLEMISNILLLSLTNSKIPIVTQENMKYGSNSPNQSPVSSPRGQYSYSQVPPVQYNPNQFPVQNPNQFPVQNPNQFPVQNPNQFPLKNPNQFPVQNPNQFPLKNPNQFPVQNPNQFPVQNPNQFPVQNSSSSVQNVPPNKTLPINYDLPISQMNFNQTSYNVPPNKILPQNYDLPIGQMSFNQNNPSVKNTPPVQYTPQQNNPVNAVNYSQQNTPVNAVNYSQQNTPVNDVKYTPQQNTPVNAVNYTPQQNTPPVQKPESLNLTNIKYQEIEQKKEDDDFELFMKEINK